MTNESSSSAITDLEKKIIRQVETSECQFSKATLVTNLYFRTYYFGDMNLPKDKFLQEEIKKDDGWIPLQVLLTFNRVKALTTDVDVIIAALAKSEDQLLEISEDKTKIRRSKSKPLPENRLEFWKQAKDRTLYVKGFPQGIKFDELMEFFEKHGKVENLFMRRLRDEKKTFKGSVFITFMTNELCKSFLESGPTKYDETDLIKLFESVYHNQKSEERRKAKEQKQKDTAAAKQHQKNKNADNCKNEEKEFTYKTGIVIHIKDLDEVKDADRDTIKELINKYGEVDWIDFKRGDKEAFVRVKGEENAATNVLEKLKKESDGKFIYKEVECPVDVLSGDDEKTYWLKTQKEKREAFDRKNAHKKKNRKDKFQHKKKGGRENGQKSGGHKRQGDDSCDQPAAKFAKAE
uniref:Uncharacterized protein n=1 Tax=Romanomermis culicivorax TaxID=13658 RepID=A0A915IEC7_ROMCU